jgi:hypothetical protein
MRLFQTVEKVGIHDDRSLQQNVFFLKQKVQRLTCLICLTNKSLVKLVKLVKVVKSTKAPGNT